MHSNDRLGQRLDNELNDYYIIIIIIIIIIQVTCVGEFHTLITSLKWPVGLLCIMLCTNSCSGYLANAHRV